MHNGRKLTLNERGLPEGFGLRWHTVDGKRYLYTKFQGRGLSCKTTDVYQAIDFVTALRDDAENNQNARNKGLLISNLLDSYIKYLELEVLKRGDYKPLTATITKSSIKASVEPFFGKIKASQLVNLPEKLTEYRMKRTKELCEKTGKPADKVQNTIDHQIGYLRAAYNRAVKDQKFSKALVPTFTIDKRNARKGARTRTISDERFWILIERFPAHIMPVFALDQDTGIRKKESTFIHRTKVKPTERLIELEANETKKSRARVVGVSAHIWPIIRDWEAQTAREYPNAEYLFHFQGKKLTTDMIDDAFNETCEELGWHKPRLDTNGNVMRNKNGDVIMDRSAIGWHDTRHTNTTEAGSLEGVTAIDIQRTSGMTEETRERYDHSESAKKVRDAKDRKYAKTHGQPETATAPTSQPWETYMAQLEKLITWKKEGLLTEADFQETKANLNATGKN